MAQASRVSDVNIYLKKPSTYLAIYYQKDCSGVLGFFGGAFILFFF